jgi:hypothetical protein
MQECGLHEETPKEESLSSEAIVLAANSEYRPGS